MAVALLFLSVLLASVKSGQEVLVCRRVLKLSPLVHSLGCSRRLTGVMLTDRSHVQSRGNDISFSIVHVYIIHRFRYRKLMKLIVLSTTYDPM